LKQHIGVILDITTILVELRGEGGQAIDLTKQPLE
jgi:hypothetical protein